MAEHGGLDVIKGAIVRFPQEVLMCRSSLALFRNISADDALKTKLVNDGGLQLVLGCMSHHGGDKLLQVWLKLTMENTTSITIPFIAI